MSSWLCVKHSQGKLVLTLGQEALVVCQTPSARAICPEFEKVGWGYSGRVAKAMAPSMRHCLILHGVCVHI